MNSIVLLTDFGTKDGYVGIMKGVIRRIYPLAHLIDLTHEIAPQQVREAAFVLWNAYKYFPSQTLFMCVVDPGVGTGRDIILLQNDAYSFLAPDNGLLDLVWAELPQNSEVIKVAETAYFAADVSHTFHGRDIFAPVAAHLARGVEANTLGPQLTKPHPTSTFSQVTKPGIYETQVIYGDIFGNLITGLKLPEGIKGNVIAYGRDIPICQTYGQVEKGTLLALKGSHGLLEIAINQGNARQQLSAEIGDTLNVRIDML